MLQRFRTLVPTLEVVLLLQLVEEVIFFDLYYDDDLLPICLRSEPMWRHRKWLAQMMIVIWKYSFPLSVFLLLVQYQKDLTDKLISCDQGKVAYD